VGDPDALDQVFESGLATGRTGGRPTLLDEKYEVTVSLVASTRRGARNAHAIGRGPSPAPGVTDGAVLGDGRRLATAR
jgi:hypothetical protein